VLIGIDFHVMKQTREHWGSKVGFIMAAAGSAIGLGSVWRFPYTAGENGGGAFIILYIIFAFLIALPLFMAEVVIGRKAQKAALGAYVSVSGSSNWRMLGWFNVISCFIILSFYCVVAGWCLSYILMSLSSFWAGKSPEQIRGAFDILNKSADINIFWYAIFLLINVGVVLGGVRKGIEKWSRILTPALLIILIGLFFYSMTLDGFGKAVDFCFTPNFSKLSANGVLNALGVAFFTASVGLGIILTYGSYMGPKEDIPKNAFIVLIMTVSVSILAALTIFPIVFTFNFPPEGGPGLVFKTMPVLFARLPGTLVISVVFFTLLVFTALTSSISLLETLVSNLTEKFAWTRKKGVVVATIITFIIGIPSALSGSQALFPKWQSIYGKNFFDSMNFLTSSWMMPIGGLFAIIFVGYIMKRSVVQEEFCKGSVFGKVFWVWFFFIRFMAPIAVVLVLLQDAGIVNVAGWFSSTKTP
jgi:neurotransmitter:Na+ symporter, NSS family